MNARSSTGSVLRRSWAIVILALGLVVASLLSPGQALAGVIMPAGWDANVFPANDDSSITLTLPFSINVAGTNQTTGSLNNNGVFYVGDAQLCLFSTDIDTRVGNPVTYGAVTWNGRPAFCMNFYGVRRYSAYSNTALNYMQMVIVDRSDVESGAWDLWYNYDSIEWDPAYVGFYGTAGTYEHPGSSQTGAYVDGGPFALASNSLSTATVGSYLFTARSGLLVAATNEAPTVLTSPVTLEGNVSGGYSGTISGASASDDDGTVVSFVNDASFPLSLGTHSITWTATDDDGATATGTQSVTVSDTTAPSSPGIADCSHAAGGWSSDTTIDTTLTPSTDVCAGVDGYSYSFTANVAGTPDATKVLEQDQLSFTSSSLADGTWYLNVRAVDNSGNWSDTTSYGPFYIDTAPPSGSMVLEGDATYTVSQSVSVDSAVTGASTMQITVGAVTGSNVAYSSSTVVALGSGDGTKSVTVRYSDLAGNYVDITDEIILDQTAPSTQVDIEQATDGGALLTFDAIDWTSGVDATFYRLDGGSIQTGDEVLVKTTGEHSVTYWSVDNAGNIENLRFAWFTVDPKRVDFAGADRYATALKVSQGAFADGSAASAVVCAGDRWADALSASALAGALDGPLLLTTPARLSAGIADELVRLGVTDVTVIGGASALSPAVVVELEAVVGAGRVRRIGGADRYATSSMVASETVAVLDDAGRPFDGTVLIATGVNFPDAMSAAPLAAGKGWPIVLTTPASLSTVASDCVGTIGADAAVVLGGTQALSSAVQTRLEQILGSGNVTRIGGADRYETALGIAAYGVDSGLSYDGLAVCAGENFPDALSVGVLQGRAGSVVFLTQKNRLPVSVAARLESQKSVITLYRVIGGTAAISDAVRSAIAAALLQ